MPQQTNPAVLRWIGKPLLFSLCAVPALLLLRGALLNDLGANPLEKVIHETGAWTLRLLLLTLAVTPLRRFTGWSWLQRLRRMLGLFAFAYACLHFSAWVWLDQGLSWSAILADIAKRPYVTVGFTAFVLLIPLAATSTRGMMRRLGRRWQRLHRLVYWSAGLGVLHFVWLVKADWLEPAIYAVILGVLLALRLAWLRRQSNTGRNAGISPRLTA
ncbi:MAG: sulfite oxidase subunit YedZ [Pseudomonadota bacterium]|jgi:sulfoxide reductase heme-binding subunit YedZ